MRESGREPLRVLGWPAFSNRHEQPYNALLYERLAARGVSVAEYSTWRLLRTRPHVLHLHWPDRRVRDPSAVMAATRSAGLLAVLDAARARGTRVIWTVHNLQAHEGTRHPRLEPRFWRAFTGRLDGVIALTAGGLAAARARYPALSAIPGFVAPHGHYRGAYPADRSRAEARRALGIAEGASVVAFFGQVRPYKGVGELVRTFRRLSDPSAVLLVAGMPRPATLAEELRAAAGDDPRVRLALAFVPDAEVQTYLRAADAVVLPYREILNSGSAVLALSFDRPVLVPARGAMSELATVVGPDWVRTYDADLTPEILARAIAWGREDGRPARAPLEALDWERVADATLDAYRAVANVPR